MGEFDIIDIINAIVASAAFATAIVLCFMIIKRWYKEDKENNSNIL